ncbi:MAG: hypothetical protein GEV28_11805 [Actinophytocola sp.]|nr:hypothetical protein [Actinophytocola sp.]
MIVRLVHAVLGGRDRDGTWVPVAPDSIDGVVFSGFGGKMFTVREAVRAAGIRGEFLEKYQELGVVHGLAGQAGILTGHNKDVLLLDLTHRAFGLRAERVGPGRYRKSTTSTNATIEVLLDHSVTIPTKVTRAVTFVGARDEPLTVELVERSRTDGSIHAVGTVHAPLPGHEVQVELTVDIDANSMAVLSIEDHTKQGASLVLGQPAEPDTRAHQLDAHAQLLRQHHAPARGRLGAPRSATPGTGRDHRRNRARPRHRHDLRDHRRRRRTRRRAVARRARLTSSPASAGRQRH